MKKAYKGVLISFATLLGIVPMLLFLSGCQPIDQEEVVNALLPNLWVFITHIVATVILLILAIWLVWKPTKHALAKRHEYIQNEISAAEQAKEKALKALDEAEQTKIQAYSTASEIVANAKQEAYVTKQQIEQDAKYYAEIIKEKANNEAIKIKSKMKLAMEEQVLDIAFAASSALLKDKITKKDSDKFVDEFIDALEKSEKDHGKR